MLSAADREIRLGIWKIHILFHAAKREVWGIWLLEELAEHGHHLSPGTLYPALARMERNGWLERTGDAVGDGTSTSTILAQAIFADGVRNVVAGASAVDLKRGLDRGAPVAVDSLKVLSRPVKSRHEKAQSATEPWM